MTQSAWNGQQPWYDEILSWKHEGRACLDIYYDFDEPNEFFCEDWIELGYDSYDEFREAVWQRLLIRYYPDDGTWEAFHSWDTDDYCDAFKIELSEEETVEVNESIRCLKEEGALDANDYNWDE